MIKNLSLLLVTSLFLVGCTGSTPTTTVNTPTPTTTPSVAAATPSVEPKSYTLADVAKHNTPADCWASIDGKVYNLSNAAEKHPGGDKIYLSCGKEATDMFKGVPKHSQKSTDALPNFYIGNLVK